MTNNLYFIVSETGLIKIGVSANPWSRLDQLQTGNPYRLALRGVFEYEDAYGIERVMHTLLGEFRAVGEWFSVPRTILAHAHKIAHFAILCPAIYARWNRRFGRYCIWKLKAEGKSK